MQSDRTTVMKPHTFSIWHTFAMPASKPQSSFSVMFSIPRLRALTHKKHINAFLSEPSSDAHALFAWVGWHFIRASHATQCVGRLLAFLSAAASKLALREPNTMDIKFNDFQCGKLLGENEKQQFGCKSEERAKVPIPEQCDWPSRSLKIRAHLEARASCVWIPCCPVRRPHPGHCCVSLTGHSTLVCASSAPCGSSHRAK